ncbi:class I glutamine amidotransferase-like protein, partial [Periconia macrospinosa]
FSLSNPGRTIHAGVILLGEMEILDVAPIDMLHSFGKRIIQMLPLPDEIKAKGIDIETHWITEDGSPAKLSSNITMQATDSFATCPPLDIVLMGAYLPHYTPTESELAFVRKAYADCSAFISICGGFVPAQLAGVLEGKTATAPRFMVPELNKQDPRTTWVEKRYVRDGKVWTSGALLNGLDLMNAFLDEYWPELSAYAKSIGSWPIRSVEYE